MEVARGQVLYRQVFERGHSLGKLETVGRVANRRGTRVRFRPDPDIFGETARLDPHRLFRMARSKAYLYGGVEVRWHCAPSPGRRLEGPRRSGVPLPERAQGSPVPGGRRPELCDRPALRRPRQQDRGPWIGRMGHRLARRRRWLRTFLLQHHPDPERRNPRGGPEERAVARPEGPRRADRAKPASRGRNRRRRDAELRGPAVDLHPRTRIPGPEQGPAADRGSNPHRRFGCARRVRSLARGSALAGGAPPRLEHRAGRGAPAATRRKGRGPQIGDPQAAAARQARRLLEQRRARLRTVHRRGRLGRRLGQAGARPRQSGDPAAARQDPERCQCDPRQARRRTSNWRTSSWRWAAERARNTGKAICATTRSSS